MLSNQHKIIDATHINAQKIRSILENAYIDTKSIDEELEIFTQTEHDMLHKFKFRLNPSLDSWANIIVDNNRIALCDEIFFSDKKIDFEELVMFINKLNDNYSMVKIYAGELPQIDVIVIFIAYDIFFFENFSVPDFMLQMRHFMHMHQVIIRELDNYMF